MGLTDKRQRARKYNLLPTKRGKKYRLATKKLTDINQQPTKVENFNRQPTPPALPNSNPLFTSDKPMRGDTRPLNL